MPPVASHGGGWGAPSGWGYSLTPLSGGLPTATPRGEAVPRFDPHHTKISLEENGNGVQGRECFSLLRKNPGPSLSPGEGMVNPDLMPRSLISSQPGRGFDGTGSLPLTPWKWKNPGPPLLCLKHTAQGGVKPAPHLQGGEHQGWLVRKHKEKEGTMNLESGNSGFRPGGLLPV